MQCHVVDCDRSSKRNQRGEGEVVLLEQVLEHASTVKHICDLSDKIVSVPRVFTDTFKPGMGMWAEIVQKHLDRIVTTRILFDVSF